MTHDLKRLVQRWRRARAELIEADRAATESEATFSPPAPRAELLARDGDRFFGLGVAVGQTYDFADVERLWQAMFVYRQTCGPGSPAMTRARQIVAAFDAQRKADNRARARHGVWRAQHRRARADSALRAIVAQIAALPPASVGDLILKLEIIAESFRSADDYFNRETTPHAILFALRDDLAALEAVQAPRSCPAPT